MSAPAPSEGITHVAASEGLGDLLHMVGASLALSSYGTGQLILIGRKPDGTLGITQQNFDQRWALHGAIAACRLDRALSSGDSRTYWSRERLAIACMTPSLCRALRSPLAISIFMRWAWVMAAHRCSYPASTTALERQT